MIERKTNGQFLILIPVGMAAAFSFLYLARQSIWLDEAWSVSFANLGWQELWYLMSSIELNMGLYYSTLKIWIGIFGDSEFAVRSLSATFAILTVPIIYALVMRLFDSKVALIASFLIASNGFFIRYAQDARSYSMLLLLTSLSMFLFVLAIEKKYSKFYVWHGVTNALIFYTHFFGVFALISQVVLILIAPKNVVRWKGTIISLTITVLLVIPFVTFLSLSPPPTVGWEGEIRPLFRRVIGAVMALTGTDSFGANDGGKMIFVLYFLCGVISLWFAVTKLKILIDRNSFWNYILMIMWLMSPIACLYILSFYFPDGVFRYRYAITALPALAVIVAIGIANIGPKIIRRTAFTLVIVASIYNLSTLNYKVSDRRDWMMATQTVVANAGPDDAILFYSWWSKYPFEYYYRRFQRSGQYESNLIAIWPFPLLEPTVEDNVKYFDKYVNHYEEPDRDDLRRLTKDHARLWVVLAYDQLPRHGWNSGPIIDSIEQIFDQKTEYIFDGITVLLYVKSGIATELGGAPGHSKKFPNAEAVSMVL